MGLSSILSTATGGLGVVQTQLQWRTDNINNETNTNYSRRDPTTLSTGSHGVTTTITRATDASLQKQYTDANSQSAASTVTSDYWSRLADVAGTSQSTPYLQQAMDKYTAAWKAFGTAGAVAPEPFAPVIENYYMTDPISRASVTMAKCTEAFVLSREGKTGTHG